MQEKVSTLEIRKRLGDLLNRVALRHDEFVIERKGEPLAALVPVERLAQMRRYARRHALEFMGQQSEENSALSDDAVMELALKAQKSSRKRSK